MIYHRIQLVGYKSLKLIKKTYEKKKSLQDGIMRMAFTLLAGLFEIIVLLFLYVLGNYYWTYLSLVVSVIALIVSIGIFSQARTANLKMPWIIFILTVPPFGLLMYIFVGLTGNFLGAYKRYRIINLALLPYMKHNKNALKKLKEKDQNNAGVSCYLQERLNYAVYDNSDIEYYAETLDCLDRMLEDLNNAKDFIFMEYYAIEDSVIFGRILEILERKVKEGVKVRVFYDDLGSVNFVGLSFARRLSSMGIECRAFNPFSMIFNIFLNSRDHRKIMVIDGKVGYTGGFNLADEYFHVTKPYGEWKDAGVRIEGEAVKGLTLIFLENWNALKKNAIRDEDFLRYLPDTDHIQKEECFIQPYADNPTDNEQTGENVYLSIIERANEYVYISTPYLILSDEMVRALTLAAKRGVDVRIITPGIPDKRVIYSMTRSYYHMLARDGVRIFEFTPGFNHCKLCVADDKVATCGTFNLDYRSFYHNFENGCIFFHCNAVIKVREDIDSMLEKSHEVSLQYSTKKAAFLRLGQLLLRLFAPLF